MKSIKVFAVIVFIVGSVVESLKLSRVVVPLYKLSGETAELQCLFELEQDRLYAVKWYKDNEEFFRYVPLYKPPVVAHRVEGVHVDLGGSDSKRVKLQLLDLRSTGSYRCEVSAERPSFASVHGEGRMTVVHLPDPSEGPQISGTVYEEYEVGDTLALNCTSSESFPPARLSWFINDILIEPSYIKTISPTKDLPLNVVTNVTRSISQLTMPLESSHLEGGGAKVKCVASIFAVVWQDGDEKIVGNNARDKIGYDLRSTLNFPVIDDREALVTVRGSSSTNQSNLLILLTAISLLLLFYLR